MPDLLQLASLAAMPEFRFVAACQPCPRQNRRRRSTGARRRILPARPSSGEPILPACSGRSRRASRRHGAQEDPANPSMPRLKLTALPRRQNPWLGPARRYARIEATITGRLGFLVQAQASASISGVTVMSAELTLSGTAARRIPARRNNVHRPPFRFDREPSPSRMNWCGIRFDRRPVR